MSTSQSLVLATAARRLSVGYKIVALLIVGEGQVHARTSKWNKLTLIWILKSESESKISEICSRESLPVRTAAAAGRRNSSRPVHNSSFQFQSILQDRENATLGHMTALKGLRFTNVLMIHCYTESALSYNGHKSSNIKRINLIWGTRTHWWIKTSWKSSLSMSHPTCYMLQLAVFMLISATALRVSGLSFPPNCLLVMNHTCRLYAWLHICLAVQVKLLFCFHSSSLLPIKNEECLHNSIQKNYF